MDNYAGVCVVLGLASYQDGRYKRFAYHTKLSELSINKSDSTCDTVGSNISIEFLEAFKTTTENGKRYSMGYAVL